MEFGEHQLLHLLELRRGGDGDAVGVAGDPPQHRLGGGKRLARGVTSFYRHPLVLADSSEDRRLGRPHSVTQDAPGKLDRVAQDVGELAVQLLVTGSGE
jgi:hypothetical protein